MYAIGLWIYLRSTRPLDSVGRWAFAALVAFLPVVYLANVFGPPPPTVNALWIAAFAGAMVFTVWAGWADRHRMALVGGRALRELVTHVGGDLPDSGA
jgi:hypothetical protein